MSLEIPRPCACMCVIVSPFAEIFTKGHVTVRDRETMGSCNIEPREEGPPWLIVVGHTEKKPHGLPRFIEKPP